MQCTLQRNAVASGGRLATAYCLLSLILASQVPLLRQAHAVEALKEAMTSVHEETQDEAIAQAQATRLAAMMAISRLEHPKDLYSLRICDEILKDGVDVFRSSLQGRAWGNPSIIFLPIDCLSSLANVSRCPGNRPALIGTRVLSCYSALLSKWLAQRDDGKALADICAELVLCSGDVEEQHAELELDDRELDDDELATSVPHALAEGDMVAQEDDFFVVAYGQIVEDVEESESDEGEGDGEEEEVNEDADDVDEDVEQEHESSTNAKTQDINEINWLGGMTVTGPVTKIELEFAVAAIGSLAFLPPTAAAAASSLDSATTTDSAHASSHAGYHSQSHARPFADFSRHSTLLPLLKSIGEYCHWRSPDSVAASCLGTSCFVQCFCPLLLANVSFSPHFLPYSSILCPLVRRRFAIVLSQNVSGRLASLVYGGKVVGNTHGPAYSSCSVVRNATS